MVTNGHSWSSIKTYTLSEIGVFFRTIVISEKEQKLENISQIWMGNNLSKEGLKEVLGENGTPEPQQTVEETTKEWSRLKSFMSGVK